MNRPQKIQILVYDGFELLDLAGPAGVFNAANTLSDTPPYAISVHSEQGGLVHSSCGIPVETQLLPQKAAFDAQTTTLVVGAEGSHLTAAMKCAGLGDCLRTAAKHAGRCGSVCSGAFILANTGIMDGRRSATHWAGAQVFARWFPQVQLDPEALYVVDGSIWTSAGVTTGIDMALAMVALDCGEQMKGRVAGHLVIYKVRPGYQTQFSALLNAQISAGDVFGPTVAWAEANLQTPLAVDDLARVAGMSPRTFQRKFKAETGQTPARFIMALRMEKAKDMLACAHAVKAVAPAVGFASETAFRTAFKNFFGVMPSQLAATQM